MAILRRCKEEWPYPVINDEIKELLQQCTSVTIGDDDKINTPDGIIKKSQAFPVPFPIETVRMHELKNQIPLNTLRKNISSTYPLIHERVLILMAKFLSYKRHYGTSVEKQLYENMSVCELIDRILKKRAASFVGPYDKYKLLTGEEGASGWEEIGTTHEKPPLTLEHCLSYDEMKLSALVYLSGYTHCINNGARSNGGVVQEDDVEDQAVIIGVIGPRFHRRGKMEYEDILVTEEQNIPKNGYGIKGWRLVDVFRSKDARERNLMWRRMWAEFYDIENSTFEDISRQTKGEQDEQKSYEQRFYTIQNLKYTYPIFDNQAYYRRITIIAESTLLEADHRAREAGKMAFVNVIGCGLGAWLISPHQADVYVLSFLERVSAMLSARALDHVADVNFAYIKTGQDVQDIFSSKEAANDKSPSRSWFFIENKEHPNGGINVQMQNREPSSRLGGAQAGKLLVMTYPWDSNAHPGNEWWFGSLMTSGDPAAACSTQVAELHNAHINPAVSGHNVRVIGRHGLKTLSEYCLAHT
ncbi:uncharacterized protein LOC112043752 isoform X2 [Bicyclus anynana]|uniref:Uncharacterized protein LOC112043752 isoform X2 n=1 Tax=Bicyclus anynana TaxID=110368 RepID=A0ABM3LXT1_BICAN|nr:uncharacterized protein LOC112043752 isoform X2 [Bicyclus anynana]